MSSEISGLATLAVAARDSIEVNILFFGNSSLVLLPLLAEIICSSPLSIRRRRRGFSHCGRTVGSHLWKVSALDSSRYPVSARRRSADILFTFA